jgi:phage tail P2-like protein
MGAPSLPLNRAVNYRANHQTVLPKYASKLELAVDQLQSERLWGLVNDVSGTNGLAMLLPMLWDAENCPLAFLPLLAWAVRADEFDSAWPERFQRDVIKNARRINEIRGTLGAVKLALVSLGHPNAEVVERFGARKRGDGSARGAGLVRGTAANWATYKVVLKTPVTLVQANLIRRVLEKVKRNCCWLVEFDYSQNALVRGSGHFRGEGYTRGIV